MPTTERLTFESIEAARDRIRDRIYFTPLARAWNLSELTGSRLQLKLENLQITGSFKERGALNKLLTLGPAEREAGVVAASAGNHAQGLALHATRLGIRATIVMPERTPLVKAARTRRYGANVILHGNSYHEAWLRAEEIRQETGAVFVHAFNDLEVMAGQGTIGLELLEQNPTLQNVIVPIGGGGLIAGIGCAIKETNPRIRVIGVEPAACSSMKQALAAGHPTEVDLAPTIADGVAVQKVGDLTYETARQYVDDIVTVSEEDIARAILLLLEEEKVCAEGAGASSLAALLDQNMPDIRGQRTALIICGGNIDINLMSQIIDRGLVRAGRMARLDIMIPDVPGALARLTQIMSLHNANILEIHHDRTFKGALGETDVQLTIETTGFEHIERIAAALLDEGYLIQASMPGLPDA
ncbi:MAG: threonine ammonia-lyase [Deltaproteobacteria bacterium]|nr:MAG: threonine ammonia-lyase [Deltaproteobacteria bacterium]